MHWVKDCIRLGILAEYLKKYASEVVNMLIQEWDWDVAKAVWQKEAAAEATVQATAQADAKWQTVVADKDAKLQSVVAEKNAIIADNNAKLQSVVAEKNAVIEDKNAIIAELRAQVYKSQ